MHNKSWFVEVNGVRETFTDWLVAKNAFAKAVGKCYLCRGNGTCLDCK